MRCSFRGDYKPDNDKNHNVMKGRSVAAFVTWRIKYLASQVACEAVKILCFRRFLRMRLDKLKIQS